MATSSALLSLMPLGFEMLFYIIGVFFGIYTLFLIYHWFVYGTQRSIALLTLLVYLGVGAVLLLVMYVSLAAL